jgi:hypothetical protein
MSDTFLALGNTGAAAHRRWTAGTSVMSMSESHHTPTIKAQYDIPKAHKLIELRHPDPALTPKLELKIPALQIRGSWAKLLVKHSAKMARFSFASFIWKSMFQLLNETFMNIFVQVGFMLLVAKRIHLDLFIVTFGV